MKTLALGLWLAAVPMATDSGDSLSCEAGPLLRTFGTVSWNVYACADGKSVVVVPQAAIDGQFGYFFLTSDGKDVIVSGEGWGKSSVYELVFKELQKLTNEDLASMADLAVEVKGAATVNQ